MNNRPAQTIQTANKDHISGGYTLWARQAIESEIFTDKPSEWFKIWFYIINRVNHADNGKFKRGQCFLKYDWIAIATATSGNQIKHCLEYLKKATMITTQKATRGMIVTVCNYDIYQNSDNYKSHTESQLKGIQKPHRSHTINNNDKNEQEERPPISPFKIDPLDFMTYWHKENTLPVIRVFTEGRKQMLKKRTADPLFAENWQVIIDKLRASAFHTGQNDRHWRADIDWLLGEKKKTPNYLKILELESDNKGERQTDTRNSKQEYLDARERERANANNKL